jgi:hypothetical protein
MGKNRKDNFKIPKAWVKKEKPKKDLRGRAPTSRLLALWREIWDNPTYAMDGREAKAAKECWLFVRERDEPYEEVEKLFRRFKKLCDTEGFWKDKPHLRTIGTCSRQLSALDNDLYFQPKSEGGPKYPDLSKLAEQMAEEAAK